MKKILIIFIMGMFLFPMINAEIQTLGTFQQNKCVNLLQTCSNCSFVNITSVTFPNSSFSINSESTMTMSGTKYNYTFCNTSSQGQYIYNTHGDLNGQDETGSVNFHITKSGLVSSISQSITYFIGLGGSIFLFVLLVTAAITAPRDTNIGEDGFLIGVNYWKYVIQGLWLFSYLVLVWILNILVVITNNFLPLGITAKLFSVIYFILFSSTLFIIPFGFIIFIINVLNDVRIKKAIERGIKIT